MKNKLNFYLFKKYSIIFKIAADLIKINSYGK